MGTIETVLVVAVWSAITLALLPLGLAWKRYVVRDRQGLSRLEKAILITATISYIWILGLLVLPDTFGPHYTPLRYTAIALNLAAGIVCTVLAVSFAKRALTVKVATAWMAVLWLYVLAISSVV